MIEAANRKLADAIDARFALSKEVKEAFAGVNRKAFVSDGFKHMAYKLDALPMSSSQWISSPLTVAKMTEYLKPVGADSVLEIGLGSGYQAAILSRLIRRVFSIERIERLCLEARERIKGEQIINIHTKLDDGHVGWERYAPFERLLFSASTSTIPQNLFAQLDEGGIAVAPIVVGDKQIITRFVKRGASIYKEELEACSFVPMLKGVG